MSDKILFNKRLGETPLEATERLRAERGIPEDVPMTYAGRLDPMAEGLLLVLLGDECKRKDDYLGLDKEYEGEMILGVSTDTGDILGIPELDEGDKNLGIQSINKATEVLVGQRKQKYPEFSSKTVQGKPLWQWTREGHRPNRPEQDIEVYSFDVVDHGEVNAKSLLEYIKSRILLVKGDFRQKEAIGAWEETLEKEKNFKKLAFKTRVSSGTYVRVLAEEFGEVIGEKAMLASLRRAKIGNMSL